MRQRPPGPGRFIDTRATVSACRVFAFPPAHDPQPRPDRRICPPMGLRECSPITLKAPRKSLFLNEFLAA
jgi:hypothetical protein